MKKRDKKPEKKAALHFFWGTSDIGNANASHWPPTFALGGGRRGAAPPPMSKVGGQWLALALPMSNVPQKKCNAAFFSGFLSRFFFFWCFSVVPTTEGS
jgi:hypothetical protein